MIFFKNVVWDRSKGSDFPTWHVVHSPIEGDPDEILLWMFGVIKQHKGH